MTAISQSTLQLRLDTCNISVVGQEEVWHVQCMEEEGTTGCCSGPEKRNPKSSKFGIALTGWEWKPETRTGGA
jgi:hypothetical protein